MAVPRQPRTKRRSALTRDRVFQVAFEHDRHGDEWIIQQGIDLVTGYLERFVTVLDS